MTLSLTAITVISIAVLLFGWLFLFAASGLTDQWNKVSPTRARRNVRVEFATVVSILFSANTFFSFWLSFHR